MMPSAIQAAVPGKLDNPFYSVVGLGVVLCVGIVSLTAWKVLDERTQVIAHESESLWNAAHATATQVELVINGVEEAEKRLSERLPFEGNTGADVAQGGADTRQSYDVMLDVTSGLSQAYGIAMVDADGNLVNNSVGFPVPKINYTNRLYFQMMRDDPTLTTYVSDPQIGYRSGQLTFFVVRRLSTPEGVFRGLLVGAVEASYFEKMFSTAVSRERSVSLVKDDGTVLVRYPPIPLSVMVGTKAQLAAFTPTDGTAVRHHGFFQGKDKLTAVSLMARHPFRVAVSETFDDVIATWSVHACWSFFFAGLACLATMVSTWFVLRQFRYRHKLTLAHVSIELDSERRRAEQELLEKQAMYAIALDSMSQGLLLFDDENRIVLANQSLKRIFNLTDNHVAKGTTLENFLRFATEHGPFEYSKLDSAIDFYRSLVEKGVPGKHTRTKADGCVLSLNFIPKTHGWLVTFEDITLSQKAQDKIAHMAMHDSLTELPNRVMFRNKAEEALCSSFESHRVSILCLDLDHFKDVNDTLGHPVGDQLLRLVSSRIQAIMRKSSVMARFGGDEFAILVRGFHTRAELEELAKRIIKVVSAPYKIGKHKVTIGVSIGMALAPTDGTKFDILMKKADLALYDAKRNGRNGFSFFEVGLEQSLLQRQTRENDLRTALREEQFELFYQPLVQASSRRIIGSEALLRWRHPTLGLVPPNDFIPFAEENGFIVEIGKWALNKACRDAAAWPEHLKVAVNLSVVQFRSGTLVETVRQALRDSGLKPSRLELELTESAVMHDQEMTLAILNQIKSLGVRISMDDFGTGHSSLAYLQKFPFDKIKIDRAFVRDINPTNLAIVQGVINITDTLGIITTVEGVETEQQYETMRAQQCTEIQGYLFGKPVPERDFLGLVHGQMQAMSAPRVLSIAS